MVLEFAEGILVVTGAAVENGLEGGIKNVAVEIGSDLVGIPVVVHPFAGLVFGHRLRGVGIHGGLLC